MSTKNLTTCYKGCSIKSMITKIIKDNRIENFFVVCMAVCESIVYGLIFGAIIGLIVAIIVA
jgi:hypothetical protein